MTALTLGLDVFVAPTPTRHYDVSNEAAFRRSLELWCKRTVSAISGINVSGGGGGGGLTSPVGVADGGTGRTTLTSGSLLVGNGTSAVSLLAPGAAGTVLYSNGSTWSAHALTASDVSGVPTIPVTVAQGGTSLTTLTSGAVLVGAGTSAVTFLSPGAAGTVMRSNGSNWVVTTLSASDITGVPSIPVTVAQGGTSLTTLTSGALLVGAGTSAVTFLVAGAAGEVVRSVGGGVWNSQALTAADINPGTFPSGFFFMDDLVLANELNTPQIDTPVGTDLVIQRDNTDVLTIASTAIYPRGVGNYSLGTTTNMWNGIYTTALIRLYTSTGVDAEFMQMSQTSGSFAFESLATGAGVVHPLVFNANSLSSHITFRLTSLADVMIMDVNGLRPGTDATYDLGTTSFYWNFLYANNVRGSPALRLQPTGGLISAGVLLTTDNEPMAFDLNCGTNGGANDKYCAVRYNRGGVALWYTGVLGNLAADGNYRLYDAVNAQEVTRAVPSGSLVGLRVNERNTTGAVDGFLSVNAGTATGSNNRDAYFEVRRNQTALWRTGVLGSVAANTSWRLYDVANAATAILVVAGATPDVTFGGDVTITQALAFASATVSGNILPDVTTTRNLGSGGAAWANVYTATVAGPTGSSLTLANDVAAATQVNVASGVVTVTGGQTIFAASTTGRPSLKITAGVQPSSISDGIVWYDGSFLRYGRSTNIVTVEGYSSNSPTQITSNQNNYALPAAFYVRLSSDATRSITGLVSVTGGQVDGETHLLVNVGSNPINLTNQDASSTSNNRIITGTGATATLNSQESIIAWYDLTDGRWRLA